jgi:hypothetical protein
MTTTPKFRVPAADGRFLYPFDGGDEFGGQLRVHEWADGVSVVQTGNWRSPKFLAVPADRTVAEYLVSAGRPEVLSYRRTVDNPELPETIAAADWEAFAEKFGLDDDEDYLALRFYDAERAEQQYVTRGIDLSAYVDFPIDVLDPESVVDVDPAFTWCAALPYLVFGDEFANALPGTLKNIGEQFGKEVEKLAPHAQVWTHKVKEGIVSGYVRLPYDDNRIFMQKRGRREVPVQGWKDVQFSYPIPSNISGSSKREAIDKYHAEVAGVVTAIESITGKVCSACNGDGLVGA